MQYIYNRKEARQRVEAGAKILFDAVKVTMSPKGRNVIIKRPLGITVTHDGVTVADAVEIDDTPKTIGYSVGADIIKEAAGKLNMEVGDGTTSVTVLTYLLMKESNKLISRGYNPMEVRKSMETAAKELLVNLDFLVVEVDEHKVKHVATVSAGSASIGKLIAKVANQLGKDGTITVEAGKGLEMEHEISDGFMIERGYISPFFITDKYKNEAVLEKPHIILTSKKLKSVKDIQLLMAGLGAELSRPVFIVADEISGDALNLLVRNKMSGNISVAGIQSPSFGDNRIKLLEDISFVTGASIVDEGTGDEFIYGSADKVIVRKDRTTIIKGAGKDIDTRAKLLDEQIEKETGYEKELLQKRKANLYGKVAIIKVGGASETEISEKKDRVDDAVSATKAAMDGGIVAGGGSTLCTLSDELVVEGTRVDRAVRKMIKRVLKEPMYIIFENAGIKANVNNFTHGNGINVMTGEKVDMIYAGIIDPAKVTRSVLTSAFSIAGTAITMGTLVVNTLDD